MRYFVAIVLFLSVTSAFATPLNITVPNGLGSGSGWYGAQADQSVLPGCYTGQQWDLEGFYLNGNSLEMVGGFNFVTGQAQDWGGSTHTVPSGDIFIGAGTDGLYGPAAAAMNEPAGTNVNTNFGYDYVVHIDWNNLTYQVENISSGNAVVQTVSESINGGADPWTYVSGGTPMNISGTLSYTAGLSDANTQAAGLLDENGNPLSSAGDPNNWNPADPGHNVVSLDVGWLDGLLTTGETFTTHFTYECGNDVLVGHGSQAELNAGGGMSAVPEPATFLLVGVGLGAVVLRRKVFALGA